MTKNSVNFGEYTLRPTFIPEVALISRFLSISYPRYSQNELSTAVYQRMKDIKKQTPEILKSKRLTAKFAWKYLFVNCFWASGYHECLNGKNFVQSGKGEAEFLAINLSKDLDYAKQNVIVVIKRFDDGFFQRYKKLYIVPFLKMNLIIPDDLTKIWAAFTVDGQHEYKDSLKKFKSEKQIEEMH